VVVTYTPNPNAADGRPAYLSMVPIVGSPQGVLAGQPGLGAIDTSSGNLWIKLTGNSTTGWSQITGGGGGGGGVTGGTGQPSANPGTSYAVYIQTDSVPPGLLWQWYLGGWH
jgi:hypothetical protein